MSQEMQIDKGGNRSQASDALTQGTLTKLKQLSSRHYLQQQKINSNTVEDAVGSGDKGLQRHHTLWSDGTATTILENAVRNLIFQNKQPHQPGEGDDEEDEEEEI